MTMHHPTTVAEAKARYLGSRQTRADWATYVATVDRLRWELAERAARMASLRALRITTDHNA